MRNRALEPLWRGAGGNGSAAVTGEGFRADRIIFVNDVFFCARDVVRCSDPGTPHFCSVHLHQADHLANRQHFNGHVLKEHERQKPYRDSQAPVLLLSKIRPYRPASNLRCFMMTACKQPDVAPCLAQSRAQDDE